MATGYVDSLATGSNNGTSWLNAWRSPQSVAGLSAGDVCLISSGIYNMGSYWNPPGGSLTNRISYLAAPDVGHIGPAFFYYTGNNRNGDPWLSGPTNINVVGNPGNSSINFVISGYTLGITNINTSQVSYVKCSTGLSSFVGLGGIITSGMEFSNCDVLVDNANSSTIFSLFLKGTGATDNKIYNNIVKTPYTNSPLGFGADFFSINGSGWSLYGNLCSGYLGVYTGGQHQDGWQGLGNCNNVDIYNNIFANIANYAIFAEGALGSFSGYRVFNNLMFISDFNLYTGSPGAIIFGKAGAPVVNFNDVLIANNTIVDYGASQASISINNSAGGIMTITGCFIENNVIVNGGAIVTGGGTTYGSPTLSGNYSSNAATGSGIFIQYNQFGGFNNNMRPNSSATGIIGQGINLTSLGITTDIQNSPRPSSGPWDIGAYIYLISRLVRMGRRPKFGVYHIGN